MSNAALYIGADPLTFNDIDVIKKSIGIFGFVNILLDRKNRDAEYEKYFLNFTDRRDILNHDLKMMKIDSFKIIPIDTTVQETIKANDIQTLVLNLEYQRSVNFRMMNLLKELCPNLSILCLASSNFVESHFMKTMIDSDSSMTMHKKYCSDYAYGKLKLRMTKKIALTGNLGSGMEIAKEALLDHDCMVIDLDEYTFQLYKNQKFIDELLGEYTKLGLSGFDSFVHVDGDGKWIDKCDIVEFNLKHERAGKAFEHILYQALQERMMRSLVTSYSNQIFVKFALVYEYAMEQAFDKVICAALPKEQQIKNLIADGYSIQQISHMMEIEMPIEEKADYADLQLRGSEEEIKNKTIFFLNKLQRNG